MKNNETKLKLIVKYAIILKYHNQISERAGFLIHSELILRDVNQEQRIKSITVAHENLSVNLKATLSIQRVLIL